MISAAELRPGNQVLVKESNRIGRVSCTAEHILKASGAGAAGIFPVSLKPEILLEFGFLENRDYPLAPQTREFILVLPVATGNNTEIRGYLKPDGMCFCRPLVNGLVAGNKIFHLHRLQNLYHSLTGSELQPV